MFCADQHLPKIFRQSSRTEGLFQLIHRHSRPGCFRGSRSFYPSKTLFMSRRVARCRCNFGDAKISKKYGMSGLYFNHRFRSCTIQWAEPTRLDFDGANILMLRWACRKLIRSWSGCAVNLKKTYWMCSYEIIFIWVWATVDNVRATFNDIGQASCGAK